MIDVFIGTKAQYIKTAPLLRLFAERDIPYRLIDSGQHARTAATLRRFLKVKEPDAVLQDRGNIKTIPQAAVWFAKNILVTVFRPSVLRQRIFSAGPGLCIVHGDTPSTLLGLIMAKRAGKKVVHLEAGLRSFNLLRPFPEELIRIVCMKMSDILFAPSDWAEENLKKMKVRGRVVKLDQNTNVEALYYALEAGRPDLGASVAPADIPARYCVVTFHRVETIMNKSRVRFLLRAIDYISERLFVVFVQHDPTEKKLADYGVLDRLKANGEVKLLPLQDHGDFLNLIDRSEFVLSDGGSIQEECAYLDKPCLVMRSETERLEGLDGAVRLSNFDWGVLTDFVENYPSLKKGRRTKNLKPSERILGVLLEAQSAMSSAQNPK